MNAFEETYTPSKKTSAFFKPKDGLSQIRILSKITSGYVSWIASRPVRYGINAKPSESMHPKAYFACVIANYDEEAIQLYEFSQRSIADQIHAISSEHGMPFLYDIPLTRSGEGNQTRYVLKPLPPSDPEPWIHEAFMQRRFCMDELFSSGNPLKTEGVEESRLVPWPFQSQKEPREEEIPF